MVSTVAPPRPQLGSKKKSLPECFSPLSTLNDLTGVMKAIAKSWEASIIFNCDKKDQRLHV